MEILKTGTTVIALKKNDFLILGADRKVTAGYRIEGQSLKIEKISKNIFLLTAGVVGHCQIIVDILKRELKKIEKDEITGDYYVEEILVLLRNILIHNPLYVGLILSGVKKDKSFSIYSLDPSGGYVETNKISIGSGSSYALGVLDQRYEKIKNYEEGIQTIKDALFSSITRDIASGIGIDIYVLYKKNKEIIFKKIDENQKTNKF